MTNPFQSPDANLDPDSGEIKKPKNRRGIIAIRLYFYGYLAATLVFVLLTLLTYLSPQQFGKIDRLGIAFFILISFHLAGFLISVYNLFVKRSNKWIVAAGLILNIGFPLLAYMDN